MLWILGALAYLCFGYWLGDFSNKLYYDSTPTEDLRLWGKFKRVLLFPISYFWWESRGDETDNPLILRAYTNRAHLDPVSARDKLYCKWMAFIWPLRLIYVCIGIIVLLALGIAAAGGAVGTGASWLLDLLFDLPGRAWEARKRMSPLRIRFRRNRTITDPSEFITEEFKPSQEKLLALSNELAGRRNALKNDFKEIGAPDPGDSELVREHRAILQTLLTQRFTEANERYAAVQELLAQTNAHAKQLEKLAKMNTVYARIAKRDQEAAARFEETNKAMGGIMDACRKLFEAASDRDIVQLTKLGVPFENIDRVVMAGQADANRILTNELQQLNPTPAQTPLTH